MRLVSALADCWLGLCRKAPVFRASETGIGDQPEPAHEGRPDGGTGRVKTIRRGVGAALSGMKTLIRNRQLLWFSLLAGLVLAGHFIVQWGLLLVNINNGFDLIRSPLVTFVVELLTVFCLVFLLAGLVLSLTSKNGGPVSFFQGLAMAKKYLRPLTGWSVVVALVGTLIFTVGTNPYSPSASWSLWWPLWPFLFNVLGQFPFNWTLNPDVYITYPPVDGVIPLDAFFETALIYTLIFSAINVLLFVLTLFVVHHVT